MASQKVLPHGVANRGDNTAVLNQGRCLGCMVLLATLAWLMQQMNGSHGWHDIVSRFLLHKLIIGYLNILL